MYGERIRQLRKEKNMTLRDLSDELAIPFTTLGNYEREDREPNIETLDAIANYFDVSFDYLMGRRDQKTFDEYVVYEDFKYLHEIISKANPEVRSTASAIFDRVYLLTREELVAQRFEELELIDQILNFMVSMKSGFSRYSEISDYEVATEYLKKKPEIDKCFNELFVIYTKKIRGKE